MQFAGQGVMADYVNQFILGSKMLEYLRGGARPSETSRHFVSLLAVMADGQDPQDIIRKLFEFDFTLKIRRIDWQGVSDQRKA